MKKLFMILAVLAMVTTFTSCATVPRDRYNTQKGAAIGAGVGAVGGAILGDLKGSLIGAGIGTLLGAVIGNAVDQQHQASRDAAVTNKRVVYYDDHGGAVEAFPGPSNKRTDCRKVTKRVWDKGNLVSETVEEICEGEKSTTDY